MFNFLKKIAFCLREALLLNFKQIIAFDKHKYLK